MKTLWECGLRHILAGHSSVDELLRVTDPPVANSRPSVKLPTTPPPTGRVTPAPGELRNGHSGYGSSSAHTGTDLLEGLELVEDDAVTAGATPATTGKGKTVLVVDDEDHL